MPYNEKRDESLISHIPQMERLRLFSLFFRPLERHTLTYYAALFSPFDESWYIIARGENEGHWHIYMTAFDGASAKETAEALNERARRINSDR